VTLASARWTEKKSVFVASDERSGRQIENQTSIHLFVEVEVKVVERSLRITELRLFSSSLEQSVGSAHELIRYQTGEEVDGCHRLRLGLVQTRLEYGSNASEAQLS
jgi:hypothetical protein